MDIIYLNHPISLQADDHKPTVIALGYFDGVHEGHKKVIRTAIELAEEKGATASVLTFHPHPREVLQKPKVEMRYITPLVDKIKKIEQLGVDTLYVVHFSNVFAKLTPQQFVDNYLIGLHAIHVVAGFDFTYGSLGKGTMETLPFHARQRFEQTVVKKLEKSSEKISSTKIRALLMEGKVEEIPHYLGDYYTVKGIVVDGEKRGRTIGFPTANVELSERYFIPKTGVYAVQFRVNDKWYDGVCNVGFKPTFEKKAEVPTIEVHLFSFEQSIYGCKVEIKWFKHLRDEQKFNGVEELVKQIKLDKERAVLFFN